MINAAITFVGCKVSKYDSEAIALNLRRNGYNIVDFSEKADVYVINTCTVTNTGDKKSRQTIRAAKKTNPLATVVVTGCYSQVAPEDVSKIEGVDIVVGTKSIGNIADLIDTHIRSGKQQNVLVTDVSEKSEYENISALEQNDRTRAYIKIEDGCDNFCSYCIIPYARGRVRSRRIADVLEEAKALAGRGVKEIVITGIHVGSYGKDLNGVGLIDLLKAVHGVQGIARLRLSSIEPATITPSFLRELKELPKFCEYFHLSLQSGSDATLKSMNRKYTAGEYKRAVDIIYEHFPSCSVWTDVIAGFPGEAEEHFDESMEFIESSGIVKMHVFPYSPKKGTKAAAMDNQIPSAVKSERAKAAGALSDRLYNEFLSRNLETIQEVLIEKYENGFLSGHTKNYIFVKLKSQKDMTNEIVRVRLKRIIEKCNVLGEYIE